MERRYQDLDESERRILRRIRPGGRVMHHEGTITGRIRSENSGPNMCMVDHDGGGMSVCQAANHHNTQKRCPFYEKASHADRCTDLKFDEYCGCVKAQRFARGHDLY